jgi:hypothetical protein
MICLYKHREEAEIQVREIRKLGATMERVVSTTLRTLFSQEKSSTLCAECRVTLGVSVDGHEDTLPKRGFDLQSLQPISNRYSDGYKFFTSVKITNIIETIPYLCLQTISFRCRVQVCHPLYLGK